MAPGLVVELLGFQEKFGPERDLSKPLVMSHRLGTSRALEVDTLGVLRVEIRLCFDLITRRRRRERRGLDYNSTKA